MPPSILPPAPQPKTGLGHYRVLSSTAGVHVSPLALGGMSIGNKWHDFGFGSMDKDSSFKLLDAYFDNGGNFIDTASIYQDGTSEQFIGEWAETRGVRDQVFIATKYSTPLKLRDSSVQQKIIPAEWERSEKEKKVCKALEKVASEVGAKSITSVAIAYVMHKAPYVFPCIGGRKVEHLIANMEALEINLTEDYIKKLEDELEFDPGFPNWLIGNGTVPSYLLNAAGQTYQPLLPPLQSSLKK